MDEDGLRFEAVCKVIGYITVVWGWADHALSLAIWNIDESVPAVRGHKEIPISLKNRLDYLSKALADEAALKPAESEGRALIELFKSLKKRRADLVHGATFLGGSDKGFDSKSPIQKFIKRSSTLRFVA